MRFYVTQQFPIYIKAVFIVAAICLIGIGVGAVIFSKHVNQPVSQQQSVANSSSRPVINPNSHTASRYYAINGKSNFLDFREDGAMGDFVVTLVRVGKTIQVGWDPKVGVYSIIVLDMGRIDDLADQQVIISADTIKKSENKNSMAMAVEKMTVNPYIIGNAASGITISPTQESPDTIFVHGHRYSIEFRGLQDNKAVWAAYTFTD